MNPEPTWAMMTITSLLMPSLLLPLSRVGKERLLLSNYFLRLLPSLVLSSVVPNFVIFTNVPKSFQRSAINSQSISVVLQQNTFISSL